MYKEKYQTIQKIIKKKCGCVACSRNAEWIPLHKVADKKKRQAGDKPYSVFTETGFGSVGNKAHSKVSYSVKNAADCADKARHTGAHSFNKVEELLVVHSEGVGNAARCDASCVVAEDGPYIFPGIAFNTNGIFDFIAYAQIKHSVLFILYFKYNTK